jgi:hypothetical protein
MPARVNIIYRVIPAISINMLLPAGTLGKAILGDEPLYLGIIVTRPQVIIACFLVKIT